ncbi:MAG: amidohydrolase family protein [Solirubrobacteraceae bacterium]
MAADARANGFVVSGARVFDGASVRHGVDVLVEGASIVGVGPSLEVPPGVIRVDGAGRTLLPGLIDAHIHVRPPGLAELAITFGVTTVLDMGSEAALMLPYREQAERRNDIADIRSSSAAATPTGGHPAALVGLLFEAPLPTLDTAADARAFVDARLAEGGDYIKLVIEDGAMFGRRLPTLTQQMSDAVVRAAGDRGRLAVAHVHTLAAARQAVRSGVDGLVHLFLDAPADDELIEALVSQDMFVTPTLTLLQAMVGIRTGQRLAEDPRVVPYLPEGWARNLGRAYRFDTAARYEHAVATVVRLREAGVPLLAGTDAACLGVVGTAPGVSVHRELELLVEAGLTPLAALAAATAVPAGRFGLADRGRIAPGLQADLLLVDGDPTVDIDDSLNIVGVWRRGARLARG